MDLATYAVTAVLVEGRSVRSVAASTGRSKTWVARHVALYREGGTEALAPKRRGPVTAANRTPAPIEDVIIAMRKELSDQGYDAGARTIRYHLVQLGSSAPALSPSTKKISVPSELLCEQSDSLPGRRNLRVADLRARSLAWLSRARSSARKMS